MNNQLNLNEFFIVIGYLLMSYVAGGLNLEKFLEFSTYASAINFITLLLFVISSPSHTIENPILFFFSFHFSFCALRLAFRLAILSAAAASTPGFALFEQVT